MRYFYVAVLVSWALGNYYLPGCRGVEVKDVFPFVLPPLGMNGESSKIFYLLNIIDNKHDQKLPVLVTTGLV
jgi:hypothetical protein